MHFYIQTSLKSYLKQQLWPLLSDSVCALNVKCICYLQSYTISSSCPPFVIVGAWQRWMLSVHSIRDWFPLCFKAAMTAWHCTLKHTPKVGLLVTPLCVFGYPEAHEAKLIVDAGRVRRRETSVSLSALLSQCFWWDAPFFSFFPHAAPKHKYTHV